MASVASPLQQVIEAIQHGLNASLVEDMVAMHKLPASSSDADGCSLLHWSAINNRCEIASMLISNGADVNHFGGNLHESPLMWCARYAYPRMAQILIDGGARLDAKSRQGYDALHLAAQSSNPHTVLVLLVLGRSQVNHAIDAEGNTSLLWLVKNRNRAVSVAANALSVVRLLAHTEFGGDVNVAAVDAAGNNALHILAGAPFQYNSLGASSANKLAAAASPSTPSAPLLITASAATEGDLELAWLLLQRSGDFNRLLLATNAQGLTPRQVCQAAGNSLLLRFLADAWQAQYLPDHMPVLVTVATVASLFVLLHTLGWLLGGLAFGISLAIFDRTNQANIPTRAGRLQFGFTIGVISSITACYYVYLRQHYGPAEDVLVAVTALLIFLSLHRANVTPPTVLPRGRMSDQSLSRLVQRLVQEGPQEGPAGPAGASPGNAEAAAPSGKLVLCPTCLADRASASVHCSRCDRCVVSLDHHCAFVDNCVARGNRRAFCLFCLAASAGCGLFVLLSLHVQWRELCRDEASGHNSLAAAFFVQSCVAAAVPALATATWLAAVVCGWIAALLCSQLWYIAAETSTFEVLRGMHDGSCRGIGLGRAARNVLLFCWTGAFFVTPQQGGPGGCNSPTCAHGDHHHDRSTVAVGGDWGSPPKQRDNRSRTRTGSAHTPSRHAYNSLPQEAEV